MNTQTIKGLSAVLMIAGLWLIVSPFFFAFSVGAMWNSIVLGILIIIAAAIREWGDIYSTNWASWTNVVFGIWLILSPFIIGFTGEVAAIWNTIILGIITVALAGGSVSDTSSSDVMHGSQM